MIMTEHEIIQCLFVFLITAMVFFIAGAFNGYRIGRKSMLEEINTIEEIGN